MFRILIWQFLFSCGQPVNSFLCCNIKEKKCIKRKRKHTFAIPSTWLSTFLNTIDLFTHYTVHNILKHNYTAVLKYKRLTDSWNFVVIFVFFFFFFKWGTLWNDDMENRIFNAVILILHLVIYTDSVWWHCCQYLSNSVRR